MKYFIPVKIPKFNSILLAIWMWPVIWVLTVFSATAGVFVAFPLSYLFDNRKRRLMHWIGNWWGKMIIASVLVWRIKVKGGENFDHKRHYIVVSNHQSMLDIMVAYSVIPMQFRFIAKQELFRLPYFGWHMKLAKYVPIERGSAESARKAVALCREHIRDGVSVLFFPEGTRSEDCQIHAFKNGAFKLASEEGVDILPMVIDGTGQAIPKNSRRIEKKALFKISFLKPVRVGIGPGAVENAKRHIRQQMIEELEQMRKE